jgi:RimJ/RimL family protein N-acetyltransferase
VAHDVDLMSHIIESGRVFLRPFETTDAELYRRWRADARPMEMAGWHYRAPMSLAQVEARIDRLAKDQDHDFMVFLICILADERPIGEVMLADIDRANGSAELGIFIGEPEDWGKGYGTDAVNALVDFGFGQLRLERIWLNVGTENERARRAYQKAGFVHEGTVRHDRYESGRHTDGHVLAILRDEWLALPRRAATA